MLNIIMSIKRYFVFILTLMLSGTFVAAQDTFSIVAVDTITGEIGGAGASCIDESAIPGGVLIISDIIPGRGTIHTQSYWNATNQQNAHNRMIEGMSPEEIIAWLVANDVQNNPQVRQYGITDFDSLGHPRSAAFTGTNCLNYKNHIVGPNYAIQGNILLGQQILDSMEARFLNTEGMLAEKLMAALQGAKVPGADTRCLNQGTSSLSAFVRVALPDDPPGSFWCDLVVPSTPYAVEPIDSLQVLFDQWLIWTQVNQQPYLQPNRAHVFPNPATNHVTFNINPDESDLQLKVRVYSITGKLMDELVWKREPIQLSTVDYPTGIYYFQVLNDAGIVDSGKFNILKSN
jgi:uncharacterized Ntn-hydrolase superfamily protein